MLVQFDKIKEPMFFDRKEFIIDLIEKGEKNLDIF